MSYSYRNGELEIIIHLQVYWDFQADTYYICDIFKLLTFMILETQKSKVIFICEKLFDYNKILNLFFIFIYLQIAAVLVLKENKSMILKDLQDWARDYLPPYQLPTIMTCLESMPRNAMGKVNKKELINQVFPEAIKKK